jgi:hypothetical protein
MRLSLIKRGVIAAAFVATSLAGTVASAAVAELYAGSSHSGRHCFTLNPDDVFMGTTQNARLRKLLVS